MPNTIYVTSRNILNAGSPTTVSSTLSGYFQVGEWYYGSEDTGGTGYSSHVFKCTSMSDGTVPVKNKIIQATFSAYLTAGSGSTGTTISLYVVIRNWTTTHACWNKYASEAAWETAGCRGNADRMSPSCGSLWFDSNAPINTWYTWNLLASQITLITKQAITNNGFVIEYDFLGSNRAKRFTNFSDANKPYFVLTHVLGSEYRKHGYVPSVHPTRYIYQCTLERWDTYSHKGLQGLRNLTFDQQVPQHDIIDRVTKQWINPFDLKYIPNLDWDRLAFRTVLRS